MIVSPEPTCRLRRALYANVLFSIVSGVALTVGFPWLAPWMDVRPGWLLAAVGVSLIGFAVVVARVARRRSIAPVGVWTIVGLDLGWVVASGALLFGWPNLLTDAGRAGVAVVAAVVLVIAALQAAGVVGLVRASTGAASRGDGPGR